MVNKSSLILFGKDTTVLETNYGKKEIPSFQSNHFAYDDSKGIVFFAQWDSTGNADEDSVVLTNVVYETISQSVLKDLNKDLIPNAPNHKLFNTKARNKKSYYFEMSPIINDKGVYKRITSFTINFTLQLGRSTNLSSKSISVSNSVLSTGEWYRFYIEKSGVFQLTRSFLSSLGINTSSVDPRTIKIYGNGGRMLPLNNSANYPFDVVENAVQFVGEQDGSFDSGDYILFYGEGPTTFNEDSDTNLNLFTDKTYYYINISGGNGKRIQPMPQISTTADLVIDTFQDYKFYEIDENNLAKVGRRWFGDEFDIENQRDYDFEFPNLVTSEPVSFKIYVGSVSESNSSMAVTINNNLVSTLNFNPVDLSGSVLASASSFTNAITINSDQITVSLNYNNGGNPSANAFLDYINIEATRQLIYDGRSITFKNASVANTPGIVQYNLGNASAVKQIWDITDRFNVTSVPNSESINNFSFKAQSGEQRLYLAFANSDFYQPSKDSRSSVENQNIKRDYI